MHLREIRTTAVVDIPRCDLVRFPEYVCAFIGNETDGDIEDAWRVDINERFDLYGLLRGSVLIGHSDHITIRDREDPVVLAADWATRTQTGVAPTYAGVPGATDGTFLWALKNIPIVTMGAGDRQVPHQVDEWVDLDQLVETAKIYALTALHYLWPQSS